MCSRVVVNISNSYFPLYLVDALGFEKVNENRSIAVLRSCIYLLGEDVELRVSSINETSHTMKISKRADCARGTCTLERDQILLGLLQESPILKLQVLLLCRIWLSNGSYLTETVETGDNYRRVRPRPSL